MTPGPWEDYTYASVRMWPNGVYAIQVERFGIRWLTFVKDINGQDLYLDDVSYGSNAAAAAPETREDVKRRADRAAAKLFSNKETS